MHEPTPLSDFRPTPGYWVVALSTGVIKALESATAGPLRNAQLACSRHGPVVWLALPQSADPATVLRACRSAHEVWVMDDEITEENRESAAHLAFKLRAESAGPELGERRSVLHAPEVGPVRVWQVTTASVRELENQNRGPLDQNNNHSIRSYLASLCRELHLNGPSTNPPNTSSFQDIANRYLRGVRLTMAGLFLLTVAGISALQALAMAGLNIPLSDYYAVFFMLVGTLYMWGKQHHWNERQHGLRTLEQAVKVQSHWLKAGLSGEMISAQFQLRHLYKHEWVREALRPLNWLQPEDPERRDKSSSFNQLKNWLPDELEHHKRRERIESSKANYLNAGVYIGYLLSAVFTLLVVSPVEHLNGAPWDTIFSAALGLSSSLGTLLLIYNSVMGYGAAASIHQHMINVLNHAQRALEYKLKSHEYDELLLDVGRELIQSAAEK